MKLGLFAAVLASLSFAVSAESVVAASFWIQCASPQSANLSVPMPNSCVPVYNCLSKNNFFVVCGPAVRHVSHLYISPAGSNLAFDLDEGEIDRCISSGWTCSLHPSLEEKSIVNPLVMDQFVAALQKQSRSSLFEAVDGACEQLWGNWSSCM